MKARKARSGLPVAITNRMGKGYVESSASNWEAGAMAYTIEPINILLLEESNAWVAQCLEFNVAAKGDSAEDAQDSLFQVLVAQISLDLFRRRLPLQENRPAPEWYQKAFEKAERYPTFIPANLPEGFPFKVKEVRAHQG